MTLRQLLTALSSNKGTSATLVEADNSELLTFNVEGYAAVESDILDRTVDKIVLSKTPSNIAIKITLVALPDSGNNG